MRNSLVLVLIMVASLFAFANGAKLGAANEESSAQNNLAIHANAVWRDIVFNGQPAKSLKVSLIVLGDQATHASACGNLKIDSILDGNRQPLKPGEITRPAGMLLVDQKNPATARLDNGVQISFNLHRHIEIKRIGELRGSLALQTGGSIQDMVIENVLKQAGSTLHDARLSDLGIAIRLIHSTRKSSSADSKESHSSSVPGEPTDGQDVLVFDVAIGPTPVTGLQVTTFDGKPYKAISLEFDGGIRKVKFAAEKFANDSQLRLTVHRDAKVINVPFVLTDIETDARLHADGKGWRLDKAKISDTTRPRVLLIGDSILNGYLKDVAAALDGKAYVDAWVNPYHQSEHVNKLLAEVLENGPYDVVHFNMGLHGWQEGRIKPGMFEPLTKAYVEVLRKKLPKAKLIWASSTPVTVKGNPADLDPAINPTIIDHNRRAATVMKEMKVPINDFYSLLVDKRDLARDDGFHWTGPAYKLLAKTVVDSVSLELGGQ